MDYVVKKTLCQYAVIRFLPFIEIGEFANMGILLFDPSRGELHFRLTPTRFRRITQFFKDVDKRFFANSVKNLKTELDRAKTFTQQKGISNAPTLFTEIIRHRETTTQFSEVRNVLTSNPEEELDNLFAYHIQRNFITPEYVEAKMEKSLRTLLKNNNLNNRFLKKTLSDGNYELEFPFVHQQNNNPATIIRPLHIAYEKGAKIIDLKGKWLARLDELRNRKLIGKNILFTIDPPPQDSFANDEYLITLETFKENDVLTVLESDTQNILTFAQLN